MLVDEVCPAVVLVVQALVGVDDQSGRGLVGCQGLLEGLLGEDGVRAGGGGIGQD